MRKWLVIAVLLCARLWAQSAPAQVSYAATNLPNFFVDANNFAIGIYSGPVLFSQLSSLTASNLVYVQDGLLGSNPCTGGGTGAFAQFIAGAWNCSTASAAQALPFVVIPSGLSAAIPSAISACPQTSGSAGCDIWLPAGAYAVSAALTTSTLKGVHLHGIGSTGTGGCATVVQTSGPIYGLTVGNGTSPNSSGFQIDNICFQDTTGNGLGAMDFRATRDAVVTGVAAFGYQVGTYAELDGGSNFTQFIHFYNPYSWQTKFGIQTNNKVASIYVWGGEFNCQNSGLTDVIANSVALDLGYTHQVASTGSTSESSFEVQSQNCQIGIGTFNSGGNKFLNKAIENTLVPRGSGTYGVYLSGDTPSLANGNYLDGLQITGAGTGIYIGPNVTNTTTHELIVNGTTGIDYFGDTGAETTVRRTVNKRLTGWQTNLATISRSSNVVTATTSANGTNGLLCIAQGAKVKVFQVTGGTTDFNGSFPTTGVTCNNSAGTTTFTWAQTGANESGTINTSGCNGNGSCVAGLSTLATSGAGVIEVTGDNVTQNIVLQTPSLPNQENFVQSSLAGTANLFFDGVRTTINENNSGLVHLVDGGTVIYNGTGVYTPQPTVVTGGNGVVNTSGTTVTWSSGNFFGLGWAGQITINNVVYTISSVTNQITLVLTATAGTQSSVNYNASGIPGVPPCSSPLGGVCQSSDDKQVIVFTNTNGATLCLPPISAGYPVRYKFGVEFEPGSLVPQYVSITPPGSTSFYSQSCLGTAALFRGLSTAHNMTGNKGMWIQNNGANWEAVSGDPDVTLDQIGNSLFNTSTNLNPLTSGSFAGSRSGANNGQDWLEQGGSSNSTGGRGADRKNISGPDSASGTNGSVGQIQTFNAGIGLATKTGFIVRTCADVVGTDCLAVPAGNSGAVRLTVSGTDTAGVLGIVSSGSGQGTPGQVQLDGVYGHNLTDGAVVESSCTAGQFYGIAGGGLDNGAGVCSSVDSCGRAGIALLATTGTCNSSTPCHVPIRIAPASCGTSGSGTTTTIASGTITLGTSAIASASCASVVTVTATGVLSTDDVMVDFHSDPTSTTGYAPSTSGTLTIIKWPSANAINVKTCNSTVSSITPGAVVLNYRVVR